MADANRQPKRGDVRSPARHGQQHGSDQVYLDGRDEDGQQVAPAGWYEIGRLCE